MKLKIGHCQAKCVAGDYAANADKVLAGMQEAASERLDILSFPECFLTGYFRSAEQARQHSFEECTISATIYVRDYSWEEKPFFASGRRESVQSARALKDIFLQTLGEMGE